jgi:hypothetical protein
MRTKVRRRAFWVIAAIAVVTALLGPLTIGIGVTSASASTTQCSNVKVPTGNVVTSIYNTSNCGVSVQPGNTYSLATPSPGLAYCSGPTNVPAGYVITQISNSASCGPTVLNGGNTYVLALPSPGLAYCGGPTNVPAGYVITRLYNVSTCGPTVIGLYPGNTYVLATPKAGLAICNEVIDGIPAGWVVTQSYNSTSCGPAADNGNTSVIEP